MNQPIGPYRKGQLTRLKNDLREMERTLDGMHTDRSGAFLAVYRVPPHLRSDWRGAAGRIAEAEAQAERGCAYTVEWLLETAELRARVEHLNNKPLAPRDPNYAGPPVWPFKPPPRERRRARQDLEFGWTDEP